MLIDAIRTPQTPVDGEISIELDEEMAQGVYANGAVSTPTDTEFVLDFLFLQPQGGQGRVRSRVLLPPTQAKLLAATLTEQVAEWEQAHGPLSAAEAP